MPWTQNSANGGFSDGHPWLPVAADHVSRAADQQAIDPRSVLGFYRDMLGFRRDLAPLLKGDIDVLSADGAHIAFTRSHGNQTILCVFNLSGEPLAYAWPDGSWRVLEDAPFATETNPGGVTLGAWSALYAAAD